MKKTYDQVLKQIEELQAQAETLRRSEVAGVIERIRGAISHYKLTAADLGLTKPGKAGKAAKAGAGAPAGGRKAGGKKGAGKAPPVVKYRNDSGGTWGGIGKRPQWLRDALASGKTLQDLLAK